MEKLLEAQPSLTSSVLPKPVSINLDLKVSQELKESTNFKKLTDLARNAVHKYHCKIRSVLVEVAEMEVLLARRQRAELF